MKRSKNVIKERFRKVKTIKYGAIALAIGSAFILSACDDEQAVQVYKTVQECKNSGANPYQCQEDYDKAVKQSVSTAPHYKSSSDCYSDFDDPCRQGTYSTGGVFWYPMMSGFHSSGSGYSSQPLYSSRGSYVDAGGYNYGSKFSSNTSRTVTRSGLSAKAPTTTTTTRGGFGSSMSSRSFSSSHSSSGGHSFGG